MTSKKKNGDSHEIKGVSIADLGIDECPECNSQHLHGYCWSYEEMDVNLSSKKSSKQIQITQGESLYTELECFDCGKIIVKDGEPKIQ